MPNRPALNWMRWLRPLGLGVLVLPVATSIPTPAQAGEALLAPLTLQAQIAETDLDRGRQLANAGRFTAAIDNWERAASAFSNRGDRVGEALTRSYLAYAYLQLGEFDRAKAAISDSQETIATADGPDVTLVTAQILNTEGYVQLATGNPEAALDTWEQAAATYRRAGDEAGALGATVNQAQALQTLGLYGRARSTLERESDRVLEQPDSALKATGLRSLGVALQGIGRFDEAVSVLENSLDIARQVGADSEISAALFALGNVASDREDWGAAADYYRQAAEIAMAPLDRTEAQLQLFSALIEQQQWGQARNLYPQVRSALDNLGASRAAVYARVNLAANLMKLQAAAGFPNSSDIAEILVAAVQTAEGLQDDRARSYALGQLGSLYQQTGQEAEAETLTRQALLLAQQLEAEEIAARWHGQLGKLLLQKGDKENAIAAYTNAVNSIETLRADLLSTESELRFSFRENIEPLYRELVGLLLEGSPSQDDLKQARQIIESLQLAELNNFFQDACLDATPKQIDEIDPKAAVVYPIVLDDRIATIVSVSGEPLRYYPTMVSREIQEEVFEDMLASLNLAYPTPERLAVSRTLYNWIITPAEQEGVFANTETLVFVLDGALRNVPMAALHDGDKYLIEKYQIALSQGLQLLSTDGKDDNRKAILAGLSESRQGFNALPNVKRELEMIDDKMGSAILLDEEFTEEALRRVVDSRSFSILHLATHGRFSSDADNTFLLTWNDRLGVSEFGDILRGKQLRDARPLDLLVLSACETAAGDKQAVLGLAGLAVRSGASSTVATLWAVRDESTADFTIRFYEELAQPDTTKAAALRQAQVAMLQERRTRHPYFWAAFVLVGNWQ